MLQFTFCYPVNAYSAILLSGTDRVLTWNVVVNLAL
jgi:hypothetical protein